VRRELLRIRIAARYAEQLNFRVRRVHYRGRRARSPLCTWWPGEKRDTSMDIEQVTCRRCLEKLERIAKAGGSCG